MATKESALTGLEPRSFWGHFETLTRSRARRGPRSPRSTTCARGPAGMDSSSQQDSGRNLVVRVPATRGREDAPTVVLQGHLDIVCERDPSSPNDPAEGRIVLVRDGDWLTADGTTLGADDGVAIAAMMALVEDESLPHGPLELLMTVAEEVGLEGANALDGSLVTGAILINLDSEEDGALTVGCAGSTDTWIRIDGARERGATRRGHAVGRGRRRARRPLGRPASPSGTRTRSRCSAACCARRTRRCRSGSSRSTAARAVTRSPATRSPSARSRATSGARSGPRSRRATAVVRDASRRPTRERP